MTEERERERRSKERRYLVLYGGLELVYSGVQALVDLTGAHLHIMPYTLIRSVFQFRVSALKLAFFFYTIFPVKSDFRQKMDTSLIFFCSNIKSET